MPAVSVAQRHNWQHDAAHAIAETLVIEAQKRVSDGPLSLARGRDSSASWGFPRVMRLPLRRLLHPIAMHPTILFSDFALRTPAEPTPPPIQEPPDPPENPDVVPIREPDPEQPGEI